jgi:hypothetical protein
MTSWWVMSAKKEETRLRRLKSLIADCAKGLIMLPLGGKKSAAP